MDAIGRAIQSKKHISGEKFLDSQTWQEFEKEIREKKVFLFGAGVCADFFWRRYKDNMHLEGIIDNDNKKQGYAIDEFRAAAVGFKTGKTIISSIDVLKQYCPNDVVILVVNLNHYTSIVKQLRDIGFKNIFVYLIMEANRRKTSEYEVLNVEMQREIYANECAQQDIISNKIVLNVDYYGGHNRAITEQLLKSEKELDVVWMVKDLSIDAPIGVRKVCSENWKKYIYEIETAKVWIWEYGLPMYLVKREEQYYIQVKHWSSITLKKFTLEDRTVLKNKKLVDEAYYNSEIMDYILVGSDFDEDSCRRGFNFHNEAIRVGSPRSDVLFRGDEIRKNVFSHYGMSNQCYVMLYAPTFRYNLNAGENIMPSSQVLDIDFERVKIKLEEKFGGEWYIFLRLHPFVAQQGNLMKLPPFVINASEYSDSQMLVAASDVLVTDYSSIMFESAFIKRPVFLYASDREAFIGKDRDLLIDYDTLPFPIAESNQELVEVIENFDKQKYEKEVTEFLDSYGVHEDGHASERAAKFIIDLLEK